MTRKLNIIACGKGTFAGAATIKCGFLSALKTHTKSVVYITDQYPQAAAYQKDSFDIQVVGSERISSVPSLDSILVNLIAEKIIQNIESLAKTEEILIWASHLFPYADAAISAKQILSKKGWRPKLLAFPVGSDIWEIGAQIPNVLQDRLNNTDIDYWATYSKIFAEEIGRLSTSVRHKIQIIPPVVTWSQRKRKATSFRNKKLMTLSCHCNMRPVKRIDETIRLAHLISEILDKEIELVLIGPAIKKSFQSDRVKIIYTGFLTNPLELVKNSDFNINTSMHDSFNYSLLESMSVGVPQITTDVAGISETIKNSGTGLVLPTIIKNDLAIFDQYKDEVFDREKVAALLTKFLLTIDYQHLVQNCEEATRLYSTSIFLENFTSLIKDSTSSTGLLTDEMDTHASVIK